MIGAVPDASLNMIGRPDDDDPCPYKPEYNIIRKWQHSCCFSLSLSTLEREKQHGGFCRERGSQTQSLVCHLGSNGRRFFFSRPSPTVLYIYIYRKKTLLIFTSSSLCVCVCCLALSLCYVAAAVEEKHKTIGPARIERKMFSFFFLSAFACIHLCRACVVPDKDDDSLVWHTVSNISQLNADSIIFFRFFVDSSLLFFIIGGSTRWNRITKRGGCL